LAGQKRGFLGSAGSRRRARASPVFVHVSLKRKRPSCSHDSKIELKHLRFIPPKIKLMNIVEYVCFACTETPQTSWFCNLQSELADRPEAIYSHNLFLFFFISVAYFYVPRSVDCNRSAIIAIPFVRSMGPNTRNVCSHSVRKDAKKRPNTHILAPRT
jgi:hypothetical protein